MIEIGSARFPLTFEPPVAGRQTVLLGVIPIGAIAAEGISVFAWSIELPLKSKMRRASSQRDAERSIEREVRDWLEAAMALSRQDGRERPGGRARARA